ncbi:hypothetical protein ACJ72_08184 [Emergomyces africanus]|uniref:HNH nuclease domain-containing protein n=1 Tax=Emergomyces africanus TaxID=1955775 RepID=A0A1B7NLK9_9EURO|nr:hypothetical protein ACJ72_08184 [Emergomyces africanus]
MDLLFDDTEAEKAERTRLLNDLDTHAGYQPFSRELWACLRLADLDCLRRIVRDVTTSSDAGGLNLLVGINTRVQQSKLLPYWKQLSRTASGASSVAATSAVVSQIGSPGQPDLPDSSGTSSRPQKRQRIGEIGVQVRDKAQRDLCRQRDKNKCVITQSGEPIEVAHIFPFAMRNLQSLEARASLYNPWNTLRMFWTAEKVDRWFNAIHATTETPRNLFCLAPHTHAYQGKAYFALKYVESNEDLTKLTVMFMWLPHFDHPHQLRVHTDPVATPVVQFREDGVGGAVGLWNMSTKLPISTGDHIVLETSDPVNLPLPDVNLLELHWLLQRVVAMAGGAEPQDETYETDDDDEWGVLIDENSDVSSVSIPSKYTMPKSMVPDLQKVSEALRSDAKLSAYERA